MKKKIARLRCRLRRRHADFTCITNDIPFVNLREHWHICPECNTVLLAELRIIPREPMAPIMGMPVEEQRRYLQ